MSGAIGDFNEKRFSYEDNINGLVPQGDPNLYVTNNLWDETVNQGVYIVNDTDLANSYTGQRRIGAAYVMYEGQLLQDLTISTGVRYESTDIHLRSQDITQDQGRLLAHNLLPSLQLAWRRLEQWVVRGSYGRTVARPSFRELAPYTSFDFIGDYLLVGNASLSHTVIDNAEVRGEWYPQTRQCAFFGNFL